MPSAAHEAQIDVLRRFAHAGQNGAIVQGAHYDRVADELLQLGYLARIGGVQLVSGQPLRVSRVLAVTAEGKEVLLREASRR